jgi:hypothetical protein
MSFLAPLFLAGLAALAVPIFVHLVNRERKEVIEFPSLMFLEQIPYRSVRRQKIRHWLLFAMRALAMILLIAAFARPFFLDRFEPPAALDSSREVVVLLDRSYSMGYGNRWDRARDAARSAIDALGGSDRATLITFAETPAALNQSTSDKVSLRASLDAVDLSSRGTEYGPALKLASRILEDSDLANREVVLITDFQKVGWDGHEEIELPEGTTLTPVDLSEANPSNIAVTSVELHRSIDEGRERVTVTARVTNTGAKPASGLAVDLEIGGRRVERRPLTIGASSAGTANFAAVALPPGITRGRVIAGTDALAADNTFAFVLAPEQALSVLIIEPADARSQHSLHLREALAIGDRPLTRATIKRVSQVTFGDLAGRSLVILNDAPFPAGELGRRLRMFVEQGGGLFAVLGPSSTQQSWSGSGAGLLPGTLGTPVDAQRGASLTSLEYAHPIFEVFSAPGSGDFTAARFYRYRPLQMTSAAGVLARFDDGAPALVEKPVGAGKVLVFTSTLDRFWNELPVQAVFLPFVKEVVRYASAYTDVRPWFTAGQVMELGGVAERLSGAANGPSRATGADAPEYVAESPSGKTIRPSAGDDGNLVELEEQGFYELRRAGGPRGAATSVAVNLDLSESDLSRVDPQELVSAVAHRGGTAGRTSRGGDLTPEEQERRQTMWWYLLAGALILLGAETVLSNRLSRAARPIA